MFEYNEQGIYYCVECGEPYEPGHSLHCKKQPKRNSDGKPNKLQDVGRHIDVGMRMLHANEDDGYFDITEFLKRGQK